MQDNAFIKKVRGGGECPRYPISIALMPLQNGFDQKVILLNLPKAAMVPTQKTEFANSIM